ncbi:MAG TPA: hypothetical protein VFW62_13540 [bacterium]|nr:hypothetical protein [bacterium]
MKKLFMVVALLCLGACGGNQIGISETSLEEQIHQAEAVALGGERAEAKSLGLLDGVSVGDGMVKVSLNIPTSQGAVAARLYLSPECLLKHDRRLVALVQGSLANGGGYYEISIPGREGFNATRVFAKAGYCPLVVDGLGTGISFHPEAGQEVDSNDTAFSVAAVARPVATILGIPKWDVYGETGLGNNVALVLARRNDVRSVVISTPFYRIFGLASGMLFDPGFRAFVASIPYLPSDPAAFPPFFGPTYPDVLAAAIDAIVGPEPSAIPTGVFLELAAIPFSFDPAIGFTLESPIQAAEPAQADALFIQGSPDPAGSEAGTAEQVAVYGATGGGAAEIVTLTGVSHLMRFDISNDGPASPFWMATLDFLSNH